MKRGAAWHVHYDTGTDGGPEPGIFPNRRLAEQACRARRAHAKETHLRGIRYSVEIISQEDLAEATRFERVLTQAEALREIERLESETNFGHQWA